MGDFLIDIACSHLYSRQKDELIVVNPYEDFVDQNRILKINVFLNRWWDYNEVLNPQTGEKHSIKMSSYSSWELHAVFRSQQNWACNLTTKESEE